MNSTAWKWFHSSVCVCVCVCVCVASIKGVGHVLEHMTNILTKGQTFMIGSDKDFLILVFPLEILLTHTSVPNVNVIYLHHFVLKSYATQ